MVASIRTKLLLLAWTAVAACVGQSQSGSPQSPTGLETPWDVRTILDRLNTDLKALKAQVDSMKPQDWHDHSGAPTTYILQWQTAERQLNDVLTTTAMFGAKTESLPLALDEYFRLEALDVTLRSLVEGSARYGSRPAADQMNQILARDFNNRERLRDYLKDLASTTEQNFKIADAEAQRCRAIISKEPTPAKKNRR